MSEIIQSGDDGGLAVPCNLDAEMSVLSACIIDDTPDKRWRRKAITSLKAGAFYLPDHRDLFELIREMHESGVDVDSTTLVDHMKRRGIYSESGGYQFLARIIGSIVSVEHVDSYIEIVKRMAGLRMAISTGRRVENLARRPNADPVVIMREASDMLAEGARRLSDGGGRMGGADELDEMTRKILAGQGQNIEMAGAPMLSKASKALVDGSITIVSGDPGDGKTFWMLHNIIEWKEQGITAAAAMLEKKRSFHLNRCRGILAGDGNVADEEYLMKNPDRAHQVSERYRDAIEDLGKSIFVSDEFDTTLPGIANWIDAQADANQVLIIDPISAAQTGANRWIEDRKFMNSVIRTTKRTGCRVILVTHPPSGVKSSIPSLDLICGGATYKQNCDCAIFIRKLEPKKTFQVLQEDQFGSRLPAKVTCNRIAHILKARNGKGGGYKFAMQFNHKTISYSEYGIVMREEKV